MNDIATNYTIDLVLTHAELKLDRDSSHVNPSVMAEARQNLFDVFILLRARPASKQPEVLAKWAAKADANFKTMGLFKPLRPHFDAAAKRLQDAYIELNNRSFAGAN